MMLKYVFCRAFHFHLKQNTVKKASFVLLVVALFAQVYAQTDSLQKTVIKLDSTMAPADLVFVSREPEPLNLNEVSQMIGYPPIAREANIEGMVVVRVLVDTEGKYVRHKLIRKAHPILSEAVEAHVHKLRFSPGLDADDEPIMFWVNMPFKFKLLDPDPKEKKRRRRRKN